MHAVLAAALLVGQPETPTEAVHGLVLRHDGAAAGGARVELQCGEWRQALTAGQDGTFVFVGVPVGPCSLVAQSADSSAGASLDLPAAREERVSVILPAGLTTGSKAAATGLQIDLRPGEASGPRRGWLDTSGPRRRWLDRTKVTGVASWSSGLDLSSPVARPDQWSVGTTVTRPGPGGTLFTGSVSARRQLGPSTLLSDVTGVPAPGGSMWSVALDATRPTMVWDVRVGLQKKLSLGGTELTIFGEAYRSFQSGPVDAGAYPLPPSATKGLRAGAAGRLGVKLAF